MRESEVVPPAQAEACAGRWFLFCPGCYAEAKLYQDRTDLGYMLAALHCFSDKMHRFDGNMESPTLSPSLLVRSSRRPEGGEYRCHSIVENGRIRFLSDCTHPLAGHTVELMDAQVYLDLLEKQERECNPAGN